MRREVVRTQPSEIFPFGPPYLEVVRKESFSHGYRACPCRQGSSYRRSRALYPFVFIVVLALIALFLHPGGASAIGVHVISVFRRQEPASPSSSDSSTTDKVVAIIFAIVGVLIFVYTAFALTSYCCRSAFKKRWCFPCYACASCGGLRCLECCGCGLCFVGLANWGPGPFDDDEEFPMNAGFDGRFEDGRDQEREIPAPV